MKLEWDQGMNQYKFEIFSHIGLFYLKINGVKKAKSDNIEKLKIYVDGWYQGHETGYSEGSDKWFPQYMDLKQKLRQMEAVQE